MALLTGGASISNVERVERALGPDLALVPVRMTERVKDHVSN